ncbi:hypothetical protein SAV31267_048420 [Streptomyces avermitilis]|uniref:Uncharacterized protein n=1 Tax=Streptomyces avermitilis TaxID=33903 RepID=A0A4D4MWB3_STRAX|nr:hypothetical protein SAV31267_048420 [Streptomyces avermitilis]
MTSSAMRANASRSSAWCGGGTVRLIGNSGEGKGAEGREAAPGVRLDRADRAAQRLGDLRLGQALPVAQHQHHPLPGGQRGQRPGERGRCGRGASAPQMGAHQRPPYVEVGVVARDAPAACVRVGQRGPRQVRRLVRVAGEEVGGADQTRPGVGGVRGEVLAWGGGLRGHVSALPARQSSQSTFRSP